MELTREEVKRCATFSTFTETKRLATALLAEMDKPKVWTNAPDDATNATVYHFRCKSGTMGCPEQVGKLNYYTRTLPKSRIDEIAEEYAKLPTTAPTQKYLESIIKSAIMKDREERGEK